MKPKKKPRKPKTISSQQKLKAYLRGYKKGHKMALDVLFPKRGFIEWSESRGER
jgi:hypothetical protein